MARSELAAVVLRLRRERDQLRRELARCARERSELERRLERARVDAVREAKAALAE